MNLKRPLFYLIARFTGRLSAYYLIFKELRGLACKIYRAKNLPSLLLRLEILAKIILFVNI